MCQPGQVVDKQDSGNALIVRYPSNKVVLILHAATVTKVKHAKKDRVMVVNSKDLVYKYHGTNATRVRYHYRVIVLVLTLLKQ